MDPIVEFIKMYLVPGSFTFFLAGLLFGAALLFTKGRVSRWGRGILLGLILGYLTLSLPVTAAGLEALLTGGYSPFERIGEGVEIQAIVILGGGGTTYEHGDHRLDIMSEATALRILEGARLYQLYGPLPVFVSGGAAPGVGKLTPESQVMAEALVALGVVEENLRQDPRSGDTYEQAINLAELLGEEGVGCFLLVTSPTHMVRSLSTFRAQGLDPTPAVSPQHSPQHPVSEGRSLLPSNDALGASQTAIRELMALLYYGVGGRLSTTAP